MARVKPAVLQESHGWPKLALVNARPALRLLALVAAVLVLGLDQVSKHWAVATLGDAGGTMVLPGPLDLTLVFNRSTAFGLAPDAGALTRWGLTGLSMAVVVALIWLVVRRPVSPVGVIGLGFIIAGAAGNAVDRVRFGAVIDFLDASKVGFVWVFNVADVALDVGLGLLLLARLRSV